MEEIYRRVYEGGEGEITEKKSRFIANTSYIAAEEEALSFWEGIRKKYWDARHHCCAYVLGENCEIKRLSDDKEPSGTAGKPILDVLEGEGLHNTIIVVTRYFGGTLLGRGGLCRAYARAAREGLSSSVIITRNTGIKLEIQINYADLNKIQYLLKQRDIAVLFADYQEEAKLLALVPKGEIEETEAGIADLTGARARLKRRGECFFADVGGEKKVLAQ